MRTVWRPTWFALGLVVFSFIGACDPEPHFATPEAPVPGSIVTEESLATTGADQQLGLLYAADVDGNRGGYRIHVSVPADAYPLGTRVTVRLLDYLERSLADFNDLRAFTLYNSGISALQILPAGRDPERALHVEFIEAEPEEDTTYFLLHAFEGDEVWSVVSQLDTSAVPVSFDATQAGLWTVSSDTSEAYRTGSRPREGVLPDVGRD
jgi:hypothetical protein